MRNSVPGPGLYEIRPVKEGPAYSFRPKFEARVKEAIPGPGRYEPSVTLTCDKAPAWVVGKSAQRTSSAGRDSSYQPGPGTYQTSGTLGGPSWRFGNQKRGYLSASAVPGPGAYEIKSTVGNSPTYVRISN